MSKSRALLGIFFSLAIFSTGLARVDVPGEGHNDALEPSFEEVEASGAINDSSKNAVTPTFVKECGSKPNCVSSAAFDRPEVERPGWYIAPIGYDNRLVNGKKAFEALMEALKSAELVVDVDYPRINAIATTRLFGFKDDLTFVLVEEEGIIHIRSESRVGYYDFGKNRRRLEYIRDQFVIDYGR